MTWQYRQAPELYTKPRKSHGVQLHQLATLRNTRHEKSVAGPQVRTTFWSWGTDADDFLRRIVSILRFWVRCGFAWRSSFHMPRSIISCIGKKSIRANLCKQTDAQSRLGGACIPWAHARPRTVAPDGERGIAAPSREPLASESCCRPLSLRALCPLLLCPRSVRP